MSLTHEVRNAKSQTRVFIDNQIPHLKGIIKKLRSEILARDFAPDSTYTSPITYAIAGAAIDYRLRAFFSNEFYRSCAIKEGIKAIRRIQSSDGENPWFDLNAVFQTNWSKEQPLAERLFEFIDEFVARESPVGKRLAQDAEKTLASISLLCANIDACSRGSWEAFDYLRSIGDINIETMLSKLDAAIVNDVSNIFSQFLVHNSTAPSAQKVHVGPVFSGSVHIGGADCDLILDNVLIDFKASKLPNIRLEYIYQLIGYFLLDYDDEYELRTLRLSFPRHQFVIDLRISELFKESAVPGIRAEFRALQQTSFEDRMAALKMPSSIPTEC